VGRRKRVKKWRGWEEYGRGRDEGGEKGRREKRDEGEKVVEGGSEWRRGGDRGRNGNNREYNV
jgi:hypothetical protein